MDLSAFPAPHTSDVKAIEAQARVLRAKAFSALLSGIVTGVARLVKAPAHLLARPRAA